MKSIDIWPDKGQELTVDLRVACINLGDITIYIPGNSHEKCAAWLMGFWEQLTDYMAEHADKEHLTDWVRKATK